MMMGTRKLISKPSAKASVVNESVQKKIQRARDLLYPYPVFIDKGHGKYEHQWPSKAVIDRVA